MPKRTITLGLVLTLVALVVGGCGYQEGVTESDQKSYLYFSGNTEGALVIVDQGAPFPIKKRYYTDSATGEKREKSGKTIYQVAPGKHRIVVKKGSVVVVDRILILGTGLTKEIQIP